MAKSAPPKKKSITSVRSRAAKRASSPSIDTDKSLKTAKPPVEEKKPSVLGVHYGAGITKKVKHGRKTVLSAKAKRRQEMAMDKAEATMDKKMTKVEKSKDRARTIQNRSKAWEEQNRKMLAKMEAAKVLEQENWIDESDDEVDQTAGAVSNSVGDVQMDLAGTSSVLAAETFSAVVEEQVSDEEL